MTEKGSEGKIIVRKSTKGKWVFEVDIGTKKPMTIPLSYDLKDDSLNGKKCEVFRENGRIVKIMLNGKELPKKQNNYSNEKKNYSRNNKHYRNNNFNSKNFSHDDNFNITKAKIPKDSRDILSTFNQKIENFNLRLNKFARYEKKDNKFIFYLTGKGKEIYRINTSFLNDFQKYAKDYRKKLKEFKSNIISITFKPEWRLIIGLGQESVYETSITLHHTYGFPYIPGQAIKGAVRSYFIKAEFEKTGLDWKQISFFEKIFEDLDLKKDKNLDYEDKIEGNKRLKGFKNRFRIKNDLPSKELYGYFYDNSLLKGNFVDLIKKFRKIFGTQNEQGKIFFFDSYPQTEPKLKVDVMNPHYSDYYSKGEPPADYLQPKPIYFLTVEDTEFEFIIGCRGSENDSLAEVKQLLNNALRNQGIGAKTAVGYGYMR